MSLLYDFQNSGMDAADYAQSVLMRRSTRGEYYGANIEAGFWSDPLGLLVRQTKEQGQTVQQQRYLMGSRALTPSGSAMAPPLPDTAPTLTEDQWKASPFYRADMPFEPGLSATAWQTRADYRDEDQYRAWVIQNRQSGFWGGAGAFIAQLAGSAPDPINYIPFGGEAFRAAMIARGASKFIAPIIAHGVEAGLGQAVAEPYVVSRRRVYGDDMSFADAALDVGMAALTGSLMASAHPAVRALFGAAKDLSLRAGERLNVFEPGTVATYRAMRALNEAIGDVVNGRRVDVGQEAKQAAASLREPVPTGDRLAETVRERLTTQGIDGETVLPRRPPQGGAGVTAAAGEASPAGGEAAPPSVAGSEAAAVGAAPPVAPEAQPRGGASAASLDRPPAMPEAARPAPEAPRAQGAPTTREQFDAALKQQLERNQAARVETAQRMIADGHRRVAELSGAKPSPDVTRELGKARGDIKRGEAALADAQRQISEGVDMPSRAVIDAAYARHVERPLLDAAGATRPRPVIDRMNTAVGRDLPEEMADPEGASVKASPDPAIEETAAVDPISGEFDELPEYAALALAGRIDKEDMAGVAHADEEFQQSKHYPAAYKAAAGCLMG